MTQEDKELLIKDLCARLPYGVKVNKVNITSIESKNRIVNLTEYNISHLTSGWWIECKPYLFPLSSMTEEQLLELSSISFENSIDSSIKTLNWCYKNHIDINNLIPMDLAIDCTNLNIY